MRTAIVICGVVLLGAGACWGRPVTVTGKVVDYQARPVAGAEVVVIENGWESATELQDAKVCSPIGRTDDRGIFEVEADIERMRDVFVVAHKRGLALAWDRAPITADSTGMVHFNLVLERPVTLSGLVVDASGRPAAQASVRAVPKTCYTSTLNQAPISLPGIWLSVQTDADGRFTFDAFSADVSCDFWVKTPGFRCTYIYTTNYLSGTGYEVWRSDIRLVLPDEQPVRGRVVEQGTGTPVADVDLMISRPTDRDRQEDIKDQYIRYPARSDADGRFVFPGVPPGDHVIDLAYPGGELSQWVVQPVGIASGPNQGADDVIVEVDPGGIAEVVARDAQTGEPAAGLLVSFSGLTISRLPRTDASGVARVRLRAGESSALISAGFSPSDRYHSWHLLGESRTFVVDRGQTVRLEADLEPASRIKGVVVGPDGQAVPGATVKTHPLSTGRSIITTVGDEFQADDEGRFERFCGDNDPRGWYVTAYCEDRGWAGIASVSQADQVVRVELKPGVIVKGVVTDADGAGIPAARVAVAIRPSGVVSNITAETLCDARGAFTISGLLPPDEAAACRLSVDASGYGPHSYVDITVSNRPGSVTDLGPIALTTANASVAGIAVDPAGQPVANVPIFLQTAVRDVRQPDKRTATDEKGRFRFERICPGPVRFQAGFSSSAFYGRGTAETGQQDVKIVLQPGNPNTMIMMSAATGLGEQVTRPTPYAKLEGKRLDRIEGLEPLVGQDAANKPLLVLFIDQQQRPSRRALLNLAGRADTLGEKGIEVVVAQVTQLDRSVLDQWFKDRNIPFEVHILEGDFNQQQHAWGVKSLPWLVLTDERHAVVEEGLSLESLER